jgi:hypothetical protein
MLVAFCVMKYVFTYDKIDNFDLIFLKNEGLYLRYLMKNEIRSTFSRFGN